MNIIMIGEDIKRMRNAFHIKDGLSEEKTETQVAGQKAFIFSGISVILMSFFERYAHVAQLDRATDSGSVGRGFKSFRAYKGRH
ncbi:MAG: hypothetical protein XE04_0549 [Marinimicrobia bacterium 46_43]|nr:MAG: hypothetical protein XE04_0549 [Marinimicrobia bacterium 46_43]